MGQQQLLLIALSVIIVGVAVAVGVNVFNEGSVSSAQEQIMQRALTVASKAAEFWRKPVSMGGGGQDFTQITKFSAQSPLYKKKWEVALQLNDSTDATIISSLTQTKDEITLTIKSRTSKQQSENIKIGPKGITTLPLTYTTY